MEQPTEELFLPVDDLKVVGAIFGIMFLFGFAVSWISVTYGGPCAKSDADLPTKETAPADSQLPDDEVDSLSDVP